MPQYCTTYLLLETALGRSEVGMEFIKFLIVWPKHCQHKAHAVVTDGELRCFVKSFPVFREALQTCPETSYLHSVHNMSWSEYLQQCISYLVLFFPGMPFFWQPSHLQRFTASNELLGGRFAKVQGALPSQAD